jgi:Ca2+-binding RTX toxin-like protein
MTFHTHPSLVLIDPAVQDYQHLVNGVHPEYEIHVLNPDQDGIDQITQLLADRHDLDSVHIVSHGQPGALLLGSARLTLATLGNYASAIRSWAKALKQQASILLYGCQVAAHQPGQTLIQHLRELTGAEIAASTHLVGSAAQGGSWILDFATGKVEHGPAFQPQVLATYSHTLAVLLDETFRNATVSQPTWLFGTGTTTSANPFLTAGSDPTPAPGGLPGGTVALDPEGNGALRLTNNANNQAAFVIYNNPIASNAGLTITFDFFAYNGQGSNGARAGGDGISFFLIDGAQSPTVAGAFGGSLGYAQKQLDGIDGIVGGYLGIGLDEFGNFSNPGDVPGGTGQREGGPGEVPDSVSIRGRGNGQNGYAFIAGSDTLSPGIDNVSATTREAASRRARIDITPTGVLSVRLDLNSDGDFLDPGETPEQTNNLDIIAANGGSIPSTFKFGFASSTGDATNIHEVRNLVISSFSTPPTVTDATVSVSANSTVNVIGLSGTDAETAIASFTIVTIPDPAQGTLFLGNPLTGGTPIAAGQTLTPDQIPLLFFQAQPGFTGSTFTYRATDTDGDFTQTPGTVTLGLSTNQPPSIGNATVDVTPGTPANITNLPATDPDGTIASFTIVTLPAADQGILFLGNPEAGGTPVTAGQILTPDQVGQLFFQPTPNFTSGSFTYTATDNAGTVGATPATITLARIDNQPPTLPNNATTPLTPTGPTNLTGLGGTDPDGTISGYVISVIPPANQGSLFLGDPNRGGTPVTVGQRLTPEQINQLFFRPEAGFTNTSFTYAAIDDRGALSNPRTITLSNSQGGVPGTANCRPGRNLRGTNGNDRLVGGPGSDRLRGLDGNDELRGRNCNDRLDGGRGRDQLFGQRDNDILRGQQGNDRLDGGRGIDLLNGGLGRDRINGRLGNDTIFGRRGNDIINGNGNTDTISGGLGRDRIKGGNGRDFIEGNRGDDRLDGGKGDDVINGGLQRDRLLGRSGQDNLTGRRGNDLLKGGSQSDTLSGGLGRDRLVGGGGDDLLIGGGGIDRFVYRNARHGSDTIVDFEQQDLIVVSRIFAGDNYSQTRRFERYIRLSQAGADTLVRIDANGNTAGGFTNLALLLNVTASSLSADNFVV